MGSMKLLISVGIEKYYSYTSKFNMRSISLENSSTCRRQEHGYKQLKPLVKDL